MLDESQKPLNSQMLSCLWIQQPYASLIAFGRKRWEFRSYEVKKRGKIGIAASLSSVLITNDPQLNLVATKFPRGVLLATADLINCFYATSSDLRKYSTEQVRQSIHGYDVFTMDAPIGEPKEDVETAINSSSWESFVWVLDNVEPLGKPIRVDRKSRSTWVNIRL